MSTANSQRFDTCVVFLNPVGYHSKRAKIFAKELQKYFGTESFSVIETSPDEKENKKIIKKLCSGLTSRSLVCIGGGDGTVSMYVNTLLGTASIPAEARQAAILPLWGGNANDLAYMANGMLRNANIKRILRDGVVAAVRPLDITLTRNGKKHHRLAVCYASFGASAHAAKIISDRRKNHRKWQRIFHSKTPYEAANVLEAYFRNRRFRTYMDSSQKKIYDIIAINGSRMAKISKLPHKLTNDTFYELTVHHKHPLFMRYIAGIFGAVVLRKRSVRHTRELTIREETWAQLDGEAVHIEPNTTVSLARNDTPFYLLGTRFR